MTKTGVVGCITRILETYALAPTKYLDSVTSCAGAGELKDALHICACSGKVLKLIPKKCSFYCKVIFWMVISYMAGTSAGAKAILQSTQSYPRVTLGCR